MIIDKNIVGAYNIQNLNNFKNLEYFNNSLKIYYDLEIKKEDFNFDTKKNFKIADDFYQKYLNKLQTTLNLHFNINENKKFYEILFGYWLSRLIHLSLDVINSYNSFNIKKSNTVFLEEFDYKKLTNYNYTHFNTLTSKYTFNNQLISLFFLKILKHDNCKFFNTKNPKEKTETKKTRYFKKILLSTFNIFQNIKNVFIKSDSIVLSHIYFFPLKNKINSKKEIVKNYKLFLDFIFTKKISYIVSNKFNNSFNSSEVKIDLEKRKQVFDFKSKDMLEKMINEVILYTFPKECFEDFQLHVNNNYISYKNIFNTGPHLADGKVKFSIANAVSKGSKLILRQVGGSYGVVENLISQKYDLNVSDKFLSWGWIDHTNLNVFPASSRLGISLTSYSKKKNDTTRSSILIVLANLFIPRREWGDRMQPEQFIQYAMRNRNFIKSVKTDIKENILIRAYNLKKNCLITNKFFKDYKFSKENYYNDIFKSKIVISTYNSTTFLECFASNIPCILFWNDEEWPLNINNDSIKDFLILKENNIMFDDPIKLSNFINSNYYNIEKWWYDDQIQNVIKNFKNKYIYSEN